MSSGNSIKVELNIELVTKGFWGIGTGLGMGGLLDRTIQKDHRQYPMIPGAALKGLAAVNFRKLAAQGLGRLEICQAKNLCAVAFCAYCQIFGSTAHKGQFIFSNFTVDRKSLQPLNDLAPAAPSNLTAVRRHNQISRLTGRAADDHLFSSEQAKECLVLNGKITGRFDSKLEKPQALYLLALSLVSIDSLGGWRTRGYGRVEVAIIDSEIKGVSMDTDKHMDDFEAALIKVLA